MSALSRPQVKLTEVTAVKIAPCCAPRCPVSAAQKNTRQSRNQMYISECNAPQGWPAPSAHGKRSPSIRSRGPGTAAGVQDAWPSPCRDFTLHVFTFHVFTLHVFTSPDISSVRVCPSDPWLPIPLLLRVCLRVIAPSRSLSSRRHVFTSSRSTSPRFTSSRLHVFTSFAHLPIRRLDPPREPLRIAQRRACHALPQAGPQFPEPRQVIRPPRRDRHVFIG